MQYSSSSLEDKVNTRRRFLPIFSVVTLKEKWQSLQSLNAFPEKTRVLELLEDWLHDILYPVAVLS